jgi:hypothetical protein
MVDGASISPKYEEYVQMVWGDVAGVEGIAPG